MHLAAMNNYTQTVELLHTVHSQLLDQVDKDGNTALHLATMENKPNAVSLLLSLGCQLIYNNMDMSAIDYAIHYKFSEAALAMVTHNERGNEVMYLRSDKYPCVTMALIANMPKVFEAVQDKCITKANCKKDSKSFYVREFAFLNFINTLKSDNFANKRNLNFKITLQDFFKFETFTLLLYSMIRLYFHCNNQNLKIR